MSRIVPVPASEFGLKSQIAAVRREISMRESVYAARVMAGRMTMEDAARQIGAMQAVHITLEKLYVERGGEEDGQGRLKL